MLRLAASSLILIAGLGPARAELRENIEFAKVGEVSLTLDAYVPEGPGPFPSVIVVHGGGFVNGDKQTYVKPLFPPLSKGGFTWFTINYRLAPKYPFPAAIEDLEAAIRWVKKHAGEYKGDPRRIALVGESAGGHIVSYAGANYKKDTRVTAVVALYGPHDLTKRARAQGKVNENLQKYLALPEALSDEAIAKMDLASPIRYVKKDMPPYLLIHGTKDPQVPYELSVDMCAKMTAAGVSCELFTVPDGGHGMGGWEKVPEMRKYKEKLVEWLQLKLKK